MANAALTAISDTSPLPKRILAKLKAQVSWIDKKNGEKISVNGVTEHIGESGALVNMDVLPAVGSDVQLRLYDDEKTIIETLTTVIRVERDPSRPLAALSVVKDLKKWKEEVITAARAPGFRKI